jgi:hypothetical protein
MTLQSANDQEWLSSLSRVGMRIGLVRPPTEANSLSFCSAIIGQRGSLVREAGFDCACSNVPDIVRPRTDPFQLPRFEVQNWEGQELEKRLMSWFEG